MSTQPPPTSSRLALDLRSLAACRIAIAMVLLVDLAFRWREYDIFLAHDGIFTIGQWREALADTWIWTMYAWSDWHWWPACLLAAQSVLAVMLLLGVWTRWTTFGCWLFAMSLHMRNPLAVNSGDTLLRMTLLWGAFSAWGECWSLDRRRRSSSARLSTVAMWPSVMLAVQLTFMYVVTGWLKVNEVWLTGEAMGRVVEMDYVIRPLGRALAQHPNWLRLITYITPWFEIAVLLIWSPWRTGALRTFFVFSYIAFHTGIAFTLNAGMFGFVSQAVWLSLLPGSFWDRLGISWRGAQEISSESPRWGNLAAGALVLVLALFSMGVNAYVNLQANWRDPPRRHQLVVAPEAEQDSPAPSVHPVQLPENVKRAMELLALGQDWTMFRNPPVECTWPVARADLLDGRQWDLLRDRPWVETGEPLVASELPSQHWRYYFRRLTFPQHHFLADRSAEYLMERWNARHPQDQAARVRLVFFEKTIGQDGFQSQVLGVAGEAPEPQDPFDIDDTLRMLDSSLNLP